MQFETELFLHRLPKLQFGQSGFAGDLEALGGTDILLEENRKATVKSVTWQEALENYEKNGHGAEGNGQERPARRKQTGKERNSGTAYGKNQTISCSLGCLH